MNDTSDDDGVDNSMLESDYRRIGIPGGASLIDRIADDQRARFGPPPTTGDLPLLPIATKGQDASTVSAADEIDRLEAELAAVDAWLASRVPALEQVSEQSFDARSVLREMIARIRANPEAWEEGERFVLGALSEET